MENPFTDRFFTKLREDGGQKIIFTENASREIIRVLKQNKLLGILVDQNARDNSIFVDFFGQKTATTRSAATLSLKMGAPIIMLFARRVVGHYKFKILVSKPIEIDIRENPHEWLWIHRRWKTRQPVEVLTKSKKI
jgi:KDO2-lipid IV(A) lauroyltransferase